MPVEELVLHGQTFDFDLVMGARDVPWSFFDFAEHLLSNWTRMIAVVEFLPDEGRAPSVGKQSAVQVSVRADQFFPSPLFFAHAFNRTVVDRFEVEHGLRQGAELYL